MSDDVKVYFQLGQLEGDYVLMKKGADVMALKEAILSQYKVELEGMQPSLLMVFRSLSATEIVSDPDEIPPSALERSTMLSVTVDPVFVKNARLKRSFPIETLLESPSDVKPCLVNKPK